MTMAVTQTTTWQHLIFPRVSRRVPTSDSDQSNGTLTIPATYPENGVSAPGVVLTDCLRLINSYLSTNQCEVTSRLQDLLTLGIFGNSRMWIPLAMSDSWCMTSHGQRYANAEPVGCPITGYSSLTVTYNNEVENWLKRSYKVLCIYINVVRVELLEWYHWMELNCPHQSLPSNFIELSFLDYISEMDDSCVFCYHYHHRYLCYYPTIDTVLMHWFDWWIL